MIFNANAIQMEIIIGVKANGSKVVNKIKEDDNAIKNNSIINE